MKLEVGMYVRYKKYGQIEKIIEYKEYEVYGEIKVKINGFKHYKKNLLKHIKKASHNIIDLIEEGDYVNGKRVGFINDSDYYKDIFLSEDYEEPYETMIVKTYKDIKSIVTKEQFESMQYKVD